MSSTNETESRRPRRELSLPTILASAGISAIVSALIVTIGVVGIVIVYGDRDSTTAAAQPTVVNLAPQAATAAQAAPAAATPAAAAPAAAAAAPTEQVASSGGGAGVAAAAPTAQSAPAQTEAPAADAAAAAPAALEPGQLNTKINTIMNTGGDRAARADELEGGEAGLASVDAVGALIAVAGGGFTYEMAGPVEVNGQSMSATLLMSLAGSGTRSQPLTWVWSGDKWKLSNASVCAIAQYALLPCSV